MNTQTTQTQAIKTYNIHVIPMSGNQNEYGREWIISADSELNAALIAQDRAEKLGVGCAKYSIRESRLGTTLTTYRTSGSAGKGFTLEKI